MHVIDPVAGNIAIVALWLVAACAVLALVLFLIDLIADFSWQVGDVVGKIQIGLGIGFVLGLVVVFGCVIAATIDVETQLQHQAQQRYGIQLSESQVSDLYDIHSNDRRTGTVNGRQVQIMGSTITNDNQVITLVQTGDTYLLENANLSELPTR